jgi:hypothetical protein
MSDGIQPGLALAIWVDARRAGDGRPFHVPYGCHEVHIAGIHFLEQSRASPRALFQHLSRAFNKIIDKPPVIGERMPPLPQHQSGEKLGLGQTRKAV